MTRLDRKIESNQRRLGTSVLLADPEFARRLLINEDPNYSSDTLDKWSEKDTFLFRMWSVVRAAPPITQIAIDFSFSKPTIAWLKASGYKHVIGYFSQSANKRITKAFCQDCLNEGITVTFVYQDSAGDPLAGAPRGDLRARQAGEQAAAIGYPAWCPTLFAVDFDALAADLSGPVKDYFHAINAVMQPARREYGSYGSFRSTEALVKTNQIKWPWQCVAWSAGRVSSHAIMLQYPGRRFYFPSGFTAYDENVLLKPFPKWGDPKPVTPDPVQPPAQRWGKYTVPMVGGFWAESDD